MNLRDYSGWSKDDLVGEIRKLARRKKFGLVWEDKPEDVATSLNENLPTFEQIKTKAIISNNELSSNILIEGDNLHALTSLSFTHQGSIDCIYIDPPYNRGQDFIYNDNYVDREDSYRHSKWLSFMNKRLRLAKELLKEDGLIFISIDDIEHSKLRLLCEEIFGEKNIVGDISVVNNLKGRSDEGFFATAHEYLIVCAKDKDKAQLGGFPLDEEQIAEYDLEDEFGPYKLVGLQKTGKQSLRADRPNMFYPIYWDESTGVVSLTRKKKSDIEILPIFTNGVEGRWRWGKDTFNEKSKTELVVKKQKRGGVVYVKMRLNSEENEERTRKPKSLWINPKYDSGSATTALAKMFGKKVFDNPKPIAFLQDIFTISTTKDSTVLDFFAGSGSTGEAILRLNEIDKGRRKFILVTNNEEKICDEVTYPRLKKVIKGYTDTQNNQINGIAENLRFFRTKLVNSKNTDSNKKIISRHITGVLSLKEMCYDTVTENDNYAVYQGINKQMAIVYEQGGIAAFKKYCKKTESKINVYVFSLSGDNFSDEFTEYEDRITSVAIPKALLNAYINSKRLLGDGA